MKGLLEVLAKSGSNPSTKTPSEAPETGEFKSDDGAGPDDPSDENFQAAAGEAMQALQDGDAASFAESLKACIEMSM
jgi:hypothetical protein